MSPKPTDPRCSIAVTDDGEDYVAFMEHQWSTKDVIIESIRTIRTLPRRQFVAGAAFFNYAEFGRLRNGDAPVILLGRSYGGLAIHAVSAGFFTTVYHSAFLPMLRFHLRQENEARAKALQSIIEWPGAFSVVFGLILDSYPILGYRRKSYIVLGWILGALFFTIMAILEFTANLTNSNCITLTILAQLGLQAACLASLAMTTELAQREHLYERGHLQSTFMILFLGSSALAQLLVSQLVIPSVNGMGPDLPTNISFGQSMVILAVASAFSIPFIIHFLPESAQPALTKLTPLVRCRELWNLLRQRRIHCVVFFLVGSAFFLNADSTDVQTALMTWSNVTPADLQYVALAVCVAQLIAVLMWKSFFVNWDWRRLWMLSLTIFISAQLVLAIPCGLGLVRQDWSYFLLVAVRQLPKGWAQVLLVVLPTEIADIGREGVMIGLVTSFCTLISIAGRSFWETLSEAAGVSVSLESIREDSSATRNRVVISAVVFAVINLLGVSMVLFLPSQKLDAQQLRSFGGYNPKARNVVIGFFLGLVSCAFVANVTAI